MLCTCCPLLCDSLPVPSPSMERSGVGKGGGPQLQSGEHLGREDYLRVAQVGSQRSSSESPPGCIAVARQGSSMLADLSLQHLDFQPGISWHPKVTSKVSLQDKITHDNRLQSHGRAHTPPRSALRACKLKTSSAADERAEQRQLLLRKELLQPLPIPWGGSWTRWPEALWVHPNFSEHFRAHFSCISVVDSFALGF